MKTNPGLGRNVQKEALKRASRTKPHTHSEVVLAIAVMGVVYGDIGTSPN